MIWVEKLLRELDKTDMDESEFTYKIAQAAMDDKKTVKIGDKEHPVKMSKNQAEKIVGDKKKSEAKKSSDHPKAYKAPAGTQRDKDLKRAQAAYARGDKDLAISIRDKMEKKAREKPGFEPKKSKYTDGDVNESLMDEMLDDLLNEVLDEGKLSAKTRTALKNKAEKSNVPLGALTAVYRKGLGAFYSSGSRPGMGAHQWAMARINSFIKGGKARQVDSAEWEKVKKHRKKKKKK
jgi:hypothetical protein